MSRINHLSPAKLTFDVTTFAERKVTFVSLEGDFSCFQGLFGILARNRAMIYVAVRLGIIVLILDISVIIIEEPRFTYSFVLRLFIPSLDIRIYICITTLSRFQFICLIPRRTSMV
jgi:hypothetical protein